ncbi:hypothetical protein, partial [Enterobacter sichuanensis]
YKNNKGFLNYMNNFLIYLGNGLGFLVVLIFLVFLIFFFKNIFFINIFRVCFGVFVFCPSSRVGMGLGARREGAV